MSEGSGLHPGVKPESQSVRGCSELREKCQKEVFNKIDDQREKLEKKMDTQHNTVMGAIGDIDKKFAYMDGQASAKPRTNGIKKNKNGKRDWGDVAIRFLIAWGPFFLLIMAYGLIQWLKSKGIM